MSDKSWLESELSRNLTKVEAPAQLWERVQKPVVTPRETRVKPLAWACAAGLVVIVAAVLSVRAHESHAAGPVIADRTGGAERAGGTELQSGDPAQIRAWVRTRTGLELALPEVLAPSVSLKGAKVVNPALPAVEVAYRVGSREVTLLVARNSGSAAVRHADLRTVNNDGKISWVMRGQVYTLLCVNPDDARVACLLCHAS